MPREHILKPIEGHTFEFTVGWFASRNLQTFKKFILPEFAGFPITYLEIGVFEGMSMAWMLQNVLTHPESRAIGVDPWLMMPKRDTANMEAVRHRALRNLSPWTTTGKLELYRSTSAEFLDTAVTKGIAGLKPGSIDLCMIDGKHEAPFVCYDAVRAHKLLREPSGTTLGGLIIFDDVENNHQKTNHVVEGIGMFIKEINYEAIVMDWKHGHCEGWRKVEKGPVHRVSDSNT